jgi:hypothetical protein
VRPIGDSEEVKPLESVDAGYVGQYMPILVEVDDLMTQAQQTNACKRASVKEHWAKGMRLDKLLERQQIL